MQSHEPATAERIKRGPVSGSTWKKWLPILLLLALIFGQRFIIRHSLKAVRAARGVFSLFMAGER